MQVVLKMVDLSYQVMLFQVRLDQQVLQVVQLGRVDFKDL
jgi:hypothetical protein